MTEYNTAPGPTATGLSNFVEIWNLRVEIAVVSRPPVAVAQL
jgi:hypothetical protein